MKKINRNIIPSLREIVLSFEANKSKRSADESRTDISTILNVVG